MSKFKGLKFAVLYEDPGLLLVEFTIFENYIAAIHVTYLS